MSKQSKTDDTGRTPLPTMPTIKWPGIVRYGLITLGAVIALIVLWPFASVPTGYRGVVTQFGEIVSVEPEGLVLLPPWRKLSIFNIRAEAATIDRADGATSDIQAVSTSLTVRYSINPDKVAEVFEKYSRDGDLSSYMQTASQEVFKAITAKYVATDLITKRALVSADINTSLREKVAIYGANVINIDMRDFRFTEKYMEAINDKVTQEQLRLAAENKLKTVEAEQKQKVAIAEAEANAQRAQADGQAYATLKQATAEADALKIQNAALSQNKDVLELRRIEVERVKAERWNGELPQNVYAGAPIPFLNLSR